MNKLILLYGLPFSGKIPWYLDNYKNQKIKYFELCKDSIDFTEFDNAVIDVEIADFQTILEVVNKAKSYCYTIEIKFIDTPIDFCLKRNSTNARRIDESIIYNEEIKKLGKWFKLSSIPDVICERIPYFTRKKLFFDMDGVLAPVFQLPRMRGEIDFVNSNYFENLPVLKSTRNVIENTELFDNYNDSDFFVLSAAPNSIVIEEKKKWLAKHYSFIPEKNIFFVNQGVYKAQMFRDLSKYLNIDPRDMCLVEDTVSIIEEVKSYNMDAIHISHFLTNFLKY